MPKMPMGFTSQSLVPDFKAEIISDFYAPLRFINQLSRFPKWNLEKRKLTLRSLAP
jgi:hypothetical protein